MDRTACSDAANPAAGGQLGLFDAGRRRDLSAADRALERLRSTFGADAVVRAALEEGHLPEARFSWQPLEHTATASPSPPPARPLVRRLFTRSRRLPVRTGPEPGGRPLGLPAHGPVERSAGPYVVAGGWWAKPVHREYYFSETRDGELLWMYYDRRRQQWFLHGQVE